MFESFTNATETRLKGFTTAEDALRKYHPWDDYVPPGEVLDANLFFGHRNAHLFRELAYRTAVAATRGEKCPGQTSRHGPLFGNVTINKGAVLFMCRLDSLSFSKEMLRAALPSGAQPPRNLSFPPEVMYNNALSVAAVRQWLDDTKNPSLIVIESLEMFADYDPPEGRDPKIHGQRLKKIREDLRCIAKQFGIVVLIVFNTAEDCAKAEGHNTRH